uniref:Large ribosomal subunit protein bL32c n=1 Tax=Dipterosiphonia australica TaxID=2007208 RepID=A0A1Z1MLX7_9FLOR|nr:ribosomal protein L32 [Dipterosiphonia australica]ARW66751.1 ribosomal protein L32 [Dipterosiphonia australica]
MAVPKKRTSKSKSRKSSWRKKALFASQKAFSLAKSLINGKSTTFVYDKSLEHYKLD